MQEWMSQAIDLATAHRPSPNPRVGAVVVRDGVVVGRGAHREAGTAHAEVHALAEAGEQARGATLYVTLEPCSHTGRTGPCTEAIVAAGIARVVYAAADPNPAAAGGAERLRTAGVDVQGGLLADRAREINRGWFHVVEHGRPWVTWKVAATLDGRTAASDGSSKWITGPDARRDVQRLRAEADAIITGTGTVLADNPRLDVRDIEVDRQPLRVVVGDRAVPDTFHLAGADVLCLPHQEPEQVLKELLGHGSTSVLLEAGSTLAGAFLRADMVDEVIAYLAPALLGEGRPMVEGWGVPGMEQIRRLDLVDARVIGADLRIRARVRE